MKKIYSLICLLTIASSFLHAATKERFRVPDFDKIKQESLDGNSKFNFEKLYSRFAENDTTMTGREYQTLYFGYMFQEDYDPFRNIDVPKDIAELQTRIGKLTKKEARRVADFCKYAIANDPFDLLQRHYYAQVMEQMGKYNTAVVQFAHLRKLVHTICSTGDGSEENPWYVISADNEYALLNMLNYTAIDHSTEANETIDIITVMDRNRQTKRLYFNVAKPLEIEQIKFAE